MSSPQSSYSSGSSRSPDSYTRTPSRSDMSDSDEDPSPYSSPLSSCSLFTLLGGFPGPRLNSDSVPKRGDVSRVVRRLFTAGRSHTAEVIELSSDEEMDTSDIEFLEEVIDIAGAGEGENEVLKHIVMGQNEDSISDADDEGEGGLYPVIGSEDDDDSSPFAGLGSGPAPIFPIGSPLPSFHEMRPHGIFGSGDADLSIFGESQDGGVFDFNNTEETMADFPPIMSESGGQDEAFPDEFEMFTAKVYEDEELVGEVFEVSVGPEDQGIPLVHEESAELHGGARWSGGVVGPGEPSGGQDVGPMEIGNNGRDEGEALDVTQVVPVTLPTVVASPDDFGCLDEDYCGPDERVPMTLALPQVNGYEAALSDC